ncbi:aspartic peptidase domain-containing protein [Cristinia sonorae]|uniref:Aspartic peptidase domain-containing protein n=1 Tax=Cristinia sonorae TaxID=1940300 RepID=A0A8K0XM19_9AGAR|nr:aspartic peptidase domain-containing protein [Cristinia sonorae]
MIGPNVLITTLLASAGLAAGNVAKRDDGLGVFVPARVNLHLNFDTAGRYVIGVQMGPSRLNLTMTTGSGMTYVAGNTCAQCADDGVNLYNQGASSTAQQFSAVGNVPFFNGTAGASIIKENCSLPTVAGAPWVYPNQTVAVMRDVSSNVLNQVSGANVAGSVSGLVGLGTNRKVTSGGSSTPDLSTYTPNFEDSIMGQWLSIHPTALNFTFGIALNKPLLTPKKNTGTPPTLPTIPSTAGIVHWLQPDDTAYDSKTLSWASVNTSPDTQNPFATDPQDWIVNLDGWTVAVGPNTLRHNAPFVANVDPLYQGIYIPLDQATIIHAAIPGSVAQPLVSSLGQLAQTWRIPCDAVFSMGIVVQSQTFILDRDTLVIQNADGTCTSGLEAWTDAQVGQYLLGARFMSALYIIFTVPRDGDSQIGFANRADPKPKSHTGAIVGGAVGGAVGLIVLALAGWYFFWRRRHVPYSATRATMDLDDKPYDGSTGTRVTSYPIFTPGSPQHLHSPSTSAFSEGQTLTYSASAVGGAQISPPLSSSQFVFVDQMGQFGTPVTSPHSAMYLVSPDSATVTAPPAYDYDESVAGSSSAQARRVRPGAQEKGS